MRDLLSETGQYARASDADLADFNPFNLIAVQGDTATFLSNRPSEMRQALAPGVYGLSNGKLDEPWPKTVRLKDSMRGWLAAGAERPELLFEGLREKTLPRDGAQAAMPSDVPQEPSPSPIFIQNPIYGTRCSTVAAIDDFGQGRIAERRFTARGATSGETTLSFSWPE